MRVKIQIQKELKFIECQADPAIGMASIGTFIANFTRTRGKLLDWPKGLDASTSDRNGQSYQAKSRRANGEYLRIGLSEWRIQTQNSLADRSIILQVHRFAILAKTSRKLQIRIGCWAGKITLPYKGISLDFLFDFRYGGIVVSRNQKQSEVTSGQLAETVLRNVKRLWLECGRKR